MERTMTTAEKQQAVTDYSNLIAMNMMAAQHQNDKMVGGMLIKILYVESVEEKPEGYIEFAAKAVELLMESDGVEDFIASVVKMNLDKYGLDTVLNSFKRSYSDQGFAELAAATAVAYIDSCADGDGQIYAEEIVGGIVRAAVMRMMIKNNFNNDKSYVEKMLQLDEDMQEGVNEIMKIGRELQDDESVSEREMMDELFKVFETLFKSLIREGKM